MLNQVNIMFCREVYQILMMSIPFLTKITISQQFKNNYVHTWWLSSFGNFLFPCWFHCSHGTDCLYTWREPKSYHQAKYNQFHVQEMIGCTNILKEI